MICLSLPYFTILLGIHYQTTPFNGWYQIIEIARDLLDRQRYDLTEVVAAACDIPKTTFSLWRDDAQLQVHKAILHSFAENSVSCVDHHTSSEALDYYSSEVKERGKCPGKPFILPMSVNLRN
jgi:nitric-oxide synthase